MLYFIYNGVTTSTQATTAEQHMSTNFMISFMLERFVYMPLSSITNYIYTNPFSKFVLINFPRRTWEEKPNFQYCGREKGSAAFYRSCF